MKVTYDPEVDVLRIVLSSAPIEESDEDKPGVILDYDREGNIVGLEILDASTRMENPGAVEYAVTGQPCMQISHAEIGAPLAHVGAEAKLAACSGSLSSR
jgi:uncharacterized protein YuzE